MHRQTPASGPRHAPKAGTRWIGAHDDHLTVTWHSGKELALFRLFDQFDDVARTGPRLGTLVVQSATRGDLAAVEKAVDEEMARLLREGPTVEEVERAKTERLAGFVRGVERIGGFGGKSDVLAQGQVWGGSPDVYRKRLERVKAAGAAEVWEAAKGWLSDGMYVLEVHPFPELAAGAGGADRKARPVPGAAPEGRLPAFQGRPARAA
jgi:zinc protease